VVIVTEKIPPGAENEKEARKAFLWLLSEEMTGDLFEIILLLWKLYGTWAKFSVLLDKHIST
jgi:hypothetical protein